MLGRFLKSRFGRLSCGTGECASREADLDAIHSPSKSRTTRDLDRAQDRAAATAEPVGFVDSEELLVIDEIQRAPELLLAIKAAVDEEPRAGR